MEDEGPRVSVRYNALLEPLFDYERARRPGDPEQDRLADVLAEHFGRAAQINFQVLAYNFLRARNDACYDIWPRSGLEQAKNLLKLKKNISEASRIFRNLPESIKFDLLMASYHKDEVEYDPGLPQEERLQVYLEVSRTRSTPTLQGYLGLELIANCSDRFLLSFDAAIKSTEDGVPQANKKIEAWRLVEACDHVCKSEAGYITVPKAINGSGDFYRLISDIFALFSVESDPCDIFNSWRSHVGRRAE